MSNTTRSSTMSYMAATAPIVNKSNTAHRSNDSQERYEEYLQLIEKEQFQRMANIKMNEIVDRFLNYKKLELKQEDYTDEEIDIIIREWINNSQDEYYDYSSDEDEGSLYSDEESF